MVTTASRYLIIIIIMYSYHALINALSAHMIHINLNMIFYTHVKHSPNKTIYIKYYYLTVNGRDVSPFRTCNACFGENSRLDKDGG